MNLFLYRCTALAATLLSSAICHAGLEKGTSTEAHGLVVIEATQPNGRANDCADADCNNGPVARAIVEALKEPTLTISGMFDQINASVREATSGRQIPWLTSSSRINIPLIENTSPSFALVIGNGAYRNTPALKGAPRDAQAVGKALAALGYQTTVLIDLDGANLSREIDRFFKIKEEPFSLIFYYAGKALEVGGKKFIIETDAEYSCITDGSIEHLRVSGILNYMKGSLAKNKILIFDTDYVPYVDPVCR